MSIVIPKSYSHQRISQKTRVVELLKTSQEVSCSAYQKVDQSSYKSLKPQSLFVLVNPLFFHRIEATERGFRASCADDVSISLTRPLPQQQDVEKSLASPTEREEDALDWDFYLENPPLKPTATIELEFEYGGRSQPIPVTDPWDE